MVERSMSATKTSYSKQIMIRFTGFSLLILLLYWCSWCSNQPITVDNYSNTSAADVKLNQASK